MTETVQEISCSYCGDLFWDDPKEAECEGCHDLFCEDHISDQCGCWDDGSGQYVEDLNEFLCHDCHMASHEPLEYD